MDVVLLSHTHYDHLDYNTALELGNHPLWIVPMGVKSWLRSKCNITNVVELEWWDTIELSKKTAEGMGERNIVVVEEEKKEEGNGSSSSSNGSSSSSSSSMALSSSSSMGTTVTMTPSKHWTKRTFFDQNESLWGGYAVHSMSSSWYFSGDTAWDEDLFKTIGEELGPFDLASIGIGAYRPRAVMKDSHTSPSEALDIFHDVRANKFHGMHWGTWKLADEANVEPAFDLGLAREARGVSHEDAFTMEMGETIMLPLRQMVEVVETVEAVEAVEVEEMREMGKEELMVQEGVTVKEEEVLIKTMLQTTTEGVTVEEKGVEGDGTAVRIIFGQTDVVFKHPHLFDEFKKMDRGDAEEITSIIDSPHYNISL